MELTSTRSPSSGTCQPAKQTPGDGQSLTFPSNPVVLRWSGIPGAAEYLVPVATDQSLASIVFRYDNQDDPNGPPNVAATSAAIAAPLAPGMYYWGVIAGRRRGQPRRSELGHDLQLGLAVGDHARP